MTRPADVDRIPIAREAEEDRGAFRRRRNDRRTIGGGGSVRIPANADSDSDRLRTAIPIDRGQRSGDRGSTVEIEFATGGRMKYLAQPMG